MEHSVAAEAVGHIQGSVEGHAWELGDLAVIWKTLLTRQKSRTLTRGFQLFFKVVMVNFMFSPRAKKSCFIYPLVFFLHPFWIFFKLMADNNNSNTITIYSVKCFMHIILVFTVILYKDSKLL